MRVLLLMVLMVAMPLQAVVETYEFADPSLRARYQQFVAELRCPKCQNQNLADSNSEIAEDLRREVYRLLHEGKSDTEIVNYMVARYGEFVLYRPPVNQHTLWLWLAPAGLLLVGALVVVVVVRRQKRKAGPAVGAEQGLSRAEQAALDALLQQKPAERDDV